MTLCHQNVQILSFLDKLMILGSNEICSSIFTVWTQRFIVLRQRKTAQVKLLLLTCNIGSIFSAFWIEALLCPWQPGSRGIILVLFPQWYNHPLILPTRPKVCTLCGSSCHFWKSTKCTVRREKSNDSEEY